MATPLTGNGVLALIPPAETSAAASGTSPPPAESPVSQSADCLARSAVESPILIFLFFQKTIRSELERLHRAAIALATCDRRGDVRPVADRCRFLLDIYKHHCNAEDEVYSLVSYSGISDLWK